MPTVFFRHRVKNYDAWKPVYDADVSRRNAADLKEAGVFRDTADGNNLLLVWTTTNLESMKAMLASPELKAKMKEAGVIEEPTVWFAE